MNSINVNSQIIEYSRHQVLYGKNNNERRTFLTEAVKSHPIKFNEDMPTAIYIDEIGLPKVESKSNNLDEIRINRVGMTYLEFSIVFLYKICYTIFTVDEWKFFVLNVGVYTEKMSCFFANKYR